MRYNLNAVHLLLHVIGFWWVSSWMLAVVQCEAVVTQVFAWSCRRAVPAPQRASPANCWDSINCHILRLSMTANLWLPVFSRWVQLEPHSQGNNNNIGNGVPRVKKKNNNNNIIIQRSSASLWRSNVLTRCFCTTCFPWIHRTNSHSSFVFNFCF